MSFLAIDADPLEFLRPFPAEPESLIAQHWHELAIGTVFYFGLMGLAPAVNRLCFGEFYRKLTNPRRKLDFDIHFVAMVNAIVSILFCIPMFAHPMFTEDPVSGAYGFGGLVAAWTIGYFIWDLFYCCIYHYDLFGFQYLFHAFGALLVFGTTFLQFCQPFIPAFLIFELSTPFVNLNWFFTRGPKGIVSDNVYMLNGLLLMLTFFLTRCVWGVYASWKIFQMCLAASDALPFLLIPVVFTLNVGFHILNYYWFSRMVKIAMKASNGESSTGRASEKKAASTDSNADNTDNADKVDSNDSSPSKANTIPIPIGGATTGVSTASSTVEKKKKLAKDPVEGTE